jgi:hypothetical protein
MTETKDFKSRSTFVGDVTNSIVLVNSFLYFGALLAQNQGKIDIFQKSFMTDGFCISNKDQSIWY